VISYPLAVKLALEELAKLIRLRVSSDSMASLIERGDVVLVRHVNLEDLRRGDLILLEQGGGFLIHVWWPPMPTGSKLKVTAGYSPFQASLPS
jgi:hypothetical protein